MASNHLSCSSLSSGFSERLPAELQALLELLLRPQDEVLFRCLSLLFCLWFAHGAVTFAAILQRFCAETSLVGWCGAEAPSMHEALLHSEG